MSIVIENMKYKSVIPIMTSNTTPSPYVVSATHNVDHTAYQVFDENESTYIRSSIFTYRDVPWFLNIDLGENNNQLVNAYQLECFIYNSWTMNTWTFEGSYDNSTWTVLHSVTGMASWDSKTTYSFQFRNTVAYRYYRFKCTVTNGGNSICLSNVRLLTQEEVGLEFIKCYEHNLPEKRLESTDCIYFTEKGNIYMSTANGDLLKMGGSSEENYQQIIKQLSLILDDINGEVV